MKLGIDLGSSTTDYVVMDKGKIRASGSIDGVKGLISLVKKFPIASIAATGAGSLSLAKRIAGIPVKIVSEMQAIGIGGCAVSHQRSALVVSIGSGTAMVSVKKKIQHIGGTAIGGRTLLGLSKLLLRTTDLNAIEGLARKGRLENVDLTLKSIYPKGIGLLPPDSTAAHFGGIRKARTQDIARALVNMVAQSIGTLAVFGAKAYGHEKIILTGKVTQMETVRKIILRRISTLYKIPVIIPKNAGIATAIGAVIAAE